MRDPDIRHLLRQTQLSQYANDPHSKIVEELSIPAAKARIDVAVINGHLHGYEIKSASDTLQRLPSQVEAYTKVFDFLSIVTEDKYHDRILQILPEWVGLYVCGIKDGINYIREIRAAQLNNKKQGFFLAKLLWREELLCVLTQHQIPFRKKDRNWLIAETLADNLEIEKLSEIVRKILNGRSNWKLDIKEDYLEKLCDDFD